MKFTNPDDLFDRPSLSANDIRYRTDRIDLHDIRQVGTRDVNVNGAILVANVKEVTYRPRKEPNTYDYDVISNVDILNKTQIGSLRRSITFDAICKFMMSPVRNELKCSGVRVGGDDLVYPISDDGRAVATLPPRCGVVGRSVSTPQCLSGLLFKHAQPLIKTNYPLPQPGSVWPSDAVDETFYPTPVKNKIPDDVLVRMTSSGIADQNVENITHKMEILDFRLAADTFPRLKLDPNKKLDILDNKYIKCDFNNGTSVSGLEVGVINKPDFDYATYYRGFILNLNKTPTNNGYWNQSMVPVSLSGGHTSGVVWPIHEKFICNNKHFRILYDRKRANGEYLQAWAGGGMYSPFNGDPSEPEAGMLAAGDSREHGFKLPETSCIWAIEGNNNYIEIDVDVESSIFIGGSKAMSQKHVALVSFLGEGNTVVIRLNERLKFYGNYKSGMNSGVNFYVMACTNSLKNTVYILTNSGTDLSDKLIFDSASLPSADQRMLRGVLYINPPHGYATNIATVFPLRRDPIYHGP